MNKREEKALGTLIFWGVLIYIAVRFYEFVAPFLPWLLVIVVVWLVVRVVTPPIRRYLAYRWESREQHLADQRALKDGYRQDLNGVEYEEYCAAILRKHGWKVSNTPVTCDHGADLIIRKDGTDAAIQCKHYSQPVGVKAVQEALSARTYYGTNAAFVGANTGFTTNAIALAKRANVELLHHSALESIDSRMPRKAWWCTFDRWWLNK